MKYLLSLSLLVFTSFAYAYMPDPVCYIARHSDGSCSSYNAASGGTTMFNEVGCSASEANQQYDVAGEDNSGVAGNSGWRCWGSAVCGC